jgi:hypothetical protein
MPDLSTYLDADLVRSAINISLTGVDLPTSVIESAIYAGAAVLEIKKRDPLAEDRTDEVEVQHLKNALNLLTAAFLVPVLPQVLKQQTAEGDMYQLQEVDADDLVAKLRNRVAEQLEELIDPGGSDLILPTFFGLASGCRGR